MSRATPKNSRNGLPWINPVGGYGDMLMVSGVLKQVIDRDPSRRFNLVRRTRYVRIFREHEAIAEIGFPGRDDEIVGVDYWSMEELGGGEQRAYQVLARAFGLETPVEEKLYLPGGPAEDPLLHGFLPWKDVNVVIAPASDSPRKAMPLPTWYRLVDCLHGDGAFVLQVGLLHEPHVRNAYSVRGMTTPRQLLALLEKCDLVVTADSFVMHAAHLAGTPAVATWGPTQHEVYGYSDQIHLQMKPTCDLEGGQSCIASKQNAEGQIYGTPCPLNERHCTSLISAEAVFAACRKALARGRG